MTCFSSIVGLQYLSSLKYFYYEEGADKLYLPVAGLHDQHYQFLSGSNLRVGGVVTLEREESTMGNVDAEQVLYYEFVYISK